MGFCAQRRAGSTVAQFRKAASGREGAFHSARIVALGLSLSKALAVTDSSECRHVHDCALAADRTAPSNGQWTDHLTTIAMGLVVLHRGIPISS